MRRIIYPVSVWVILWVVPTVGLGASEQWLAYKYSREARRIVSGAGSCSLKVNNEAPQDVKLPELTCEKPYFGKWDCAMAGSKGMWAVVDRTDPNGLWNRLYVDSDVDGDLSDEQAIEPYQVDQYRSYFGPIKVLFKGEDGPVTYHIALEFTCREDRAYAYVRSSCWYEGTVDLGGQKQTCVLVDRNANSVFDDRALEIYRCDGIRIGDPAMAELLTVGKYVQFDDKLYECEVARDGAFVKLAEAKDVKYGEMRLAESISEVSVCGGNGSFTIRPENSVAKVPVGKYRLRKWAIERTDDKGGKWKLEGNIGSNAGDFEATTDGQAKLDFDEPVVSKLTASNNGPDWRFSQSMTAKSGEGVTLYRDGSRASAPKLRIKSKDGQYDRTFSFEYG